MMIERYQGPDGKKRLIAALAEQQIVHGDEILAAAIADAAELKEFQPGSELLTQDATDSDIYLIVSGSASVVINGREVAKRSTGFHVGEMALIDPTAKRSATVKVTETTVIAKISEPKFSELAEKHPRLWRRIAVELAGRLRERSKFLKKPNDKPLVFIASSGESMKFAEAIQNGVKSADITVQVWKDGIFEASETAIESLVAVTESYDFGVVVFSADDMVESRGTEKPAPRDNVVFELGLLMGAFGRKRTFIVKPKALDLKIPSDLLGITCLTFDNTAGTDPAAAVREACDFLRGKVSSLGPK